MRRVAKSRELITPRLIQKEAEATLSQLPRYFSLEQGKTTIGRGEFYIDTMRSQGLLRKQGACYYRANDAAPTLEQAMMVEITSLSTEELSDLSTDEFLAILKPGEVLPRLSRRSYAEVCRHADKGAPNALIVVCGLYQSLSPLAWQTLVLVINRLQL